MGEADEMQPGVTFTLKAALVCHQLSNLLNPRKSPSLCPKLQSTKVAMTVCISFCLFFEFKARDTLSKLLGSADSEKRAQVKDNYKRSTISSEGSSV